MRLFILECESSSTVQLQSRSRVSLKDAYYSQQVSSRKSKVYGRTGAGRSGGAERRRRPTAQPTSEINSNTEIHETRSANKANDGYAEIVVFFTAWTRKQRESWVLQVEDYSMFLKKDWNILDMNEQSLTNESEKFSSLRCIVTLTTSTTMPGSMQNIELYKR